MAAMASPPRSHSPSPNIPGALDNLDNLGALNRDAPAFVPGANVGDMGSNVGDMGSFVPLDRQGPMDFGYAQPAYDASQAQLQDMYQQQYQQQQQQWGGYSYAETCPEVPQEDSRWAEEKKWSKAAKSAKPAAEDDDLCWEFVQRGACPRGGPPKCRWRHPGLDDAAPKEGKGKDKGRPQDAKKDGKDGRKGKEPEAKGKDDAKGKPKGKGDAKGRDAWGDGKGKDSWGGAKGKDAWGDGKGKSWGGAKGQAKDAWDGKGRKGKEASKGQWWEWEDRWDGGKKGRAQYSADPRAAWPDKQQAPGGKGKDKLGPLGKGVRGIPGAQGPPPVTNGERAAALLESSAPPSNPHSVFANANPLLASKRTEPAPQNGAFVIDQAIADKAKPQARELKRWADMWADDADASDEDLELLQWGKQDKDKGWNQFRVNEEKFGVQSTFKEDLSQYTTKLRMDQLTPAQVRQASATAKAIERSTRHADDHGDDFEDAMRWSSTKLENDLKQVLAGDTGPQDALRERVFRALGDRTNRQDADGAMWRCPFCGAVFADMEPLLAHATSALSSADSPCPVARQHLCGLAVTKPWKQLADQLELPFDVDAITKPMEVTPETAVEVVVAKLLAAKRWKSPNMLKHHQILQHITLLFLEELIETRSLCPNGC